MAGLLCLALTLGLLPSGVVLPARAAHWADPYGQKLVEWGVMRGDISGNLNLDRPITRAELVTMINRAYGYSRKAGTPFTDVSSFKWYADDIDIAYNAGYFKGTSSTTASPESNVTREQAAVFLARNLMLQETVGETLGFSDTRTLSEWSRGLIGAAVKEGVLNGYSDGSFKPANNITRGEVAAMLVRAIGTPVNEEGDHTLGHVYGNVTLSASNVTLRDTTIAGNLYLTGGIDLGHVLLENVTVLGKIIVSGAGESISGQESVVLRNVEAEELVLDSLRSPFVTVKAQGVTDIPLTTVRTNAYLDDSSWEGYGLSRIELRGDPGSKLQLAGSIKEVMNFTPASDLQFVKGSAEKVTVDEDAIASKLLVDKNTRVDELNLDVGTTVSGEGDIGKLNVGSAGSVVEQLPDQIVIRPGIDADIDGELIGSSDAAELSAEPRLMAGYPYMKNIAPTQADGVFSGSKPGTIYWAISAVADGSVSEEDLIENPTYGGNIFQNQAGSIDAASAKTEYVSQVQQLEPDGTYYVSAILVDGRGKHSPLKVMSFATPDDTKPAFVKDPTMTKTTTDVAQTTVMANKDCLLYWALLPTGAQAPTPQEFKTGSLGGNYGYGSLSVVKNAEISITVNRQKLREKTTYDLFLWLTDHNGAQSMDAPFKLTFTTPDETPPVVTAPVQIPPYAADSANVSFSMNEAPATLFWAVVAEGDTTFIAPGDTPEETAEIMADLRTKIRVEGAGDSAISSGSAPVATAYADVRFQITKLVTATTGTNNYTMYYIGKDAAGNYSDRVRSISIKTLDTKPPEVVQKFTDEVNGQPRASSDIRLEFSETVKGDNKADGKTFLDFYQAVLSATGTSAETEAKNLLAAELAAHIRLHSVPRNGTAFPVAVKSDNQTDDNWVIDFHNARVEQENGKMVIILPNDTDLSKSALQLDSGARYYFQLLSVYDNAFIPNGILDPDTGRADPNGNLKLKDFTTIYAQVDLVWNTAVTKIDDANSQYKDVRLDVVVDVKPQSTAKVPETEVWDMIIWSDTWIGVKLYRIELDKNGDPFKYEDGSVAKWECVNEAAYPINSGLNDPGISLGTHLHKGSTTDRYKTIQTTLQEDHVYRYGFHITEVRSIKEKSETADADSWGDLVTMRFGLIAGGSGGVQRVSGDVKNNFDANYQIVPSEYASYISLASTSAGTSDILTVPKQFIDTRAPSFNGDYPHFDKTSSTITMDIQLDRPGTVYYVAAPVGEISLSFLDGTKTEVINSDNDGSGGKDGTGGAANAPTSGKTYIPEDGAGRNTYSPYIYYMSGGDTDPNNKIYTNPSYGYITNAKQYYGDNANVYVPEAPASYVSSTVHETMRGLKADTWYYIFVVLEGNGAPDQVVQVYRQKTGPVIPPELNVQGNTDTAEVTPNQDANVWFALIELNALPERIFGRYYKTNDKGELVEDKDSVIYQMINQPKKYGSQFDTSTDKDKKKQVYDYISGANTLSTDNQPVLRSKLFDNTTFNDKVYNGLMAEETATLELKNYMTSKSAEYVLLVMARHPSGGEDAAEDFRFGAVNSLFTQDEEPPELKVVNGRNGTYLRVDIQKVYKNGVLNDTQDWRNNPYDYTYTGSVTITFDKPIFVLDGGRRYGIYYRLPQNVSDGKVLSSLIGGSANVSTKNAQEQVKNEIVLTFNQISANGTITLFNSGLICNGSSFTTPVIRLTFDPTITAKELGGIAEIAQGAFLVERG